MVEVWDYERARRYLLAMERPEDQKASLRTWVDGNVPRFLRTLELVPEGGSGQRCLEIGSLPYTFTLLMKKLRRYEMLQVDYYGEVEGPRRLVETIRLPEFGEEHRFESVLCDLERDPLPWADSSIDGALCCEVLEHVTRDPVTMLVEIHRVLRPGAWFVLTTPNVARMRNALNILHGRNVYERYELTFGPTWRHNREYTPREVADLLTATGYVVERVIVEDAFPPGFRPSLAERLMRRALEAVYRQNYGGQIYVLARRGPVAHRAYPDWLFEHAPGGATPPA